jgi:hypothetical protein
MNNIYSKKIKLKIKRKMKQSKKYIERRELSDNEKIAIQVLRDLHFTIKIFSD